MQHTLNISSISESLLNQLSKSVQSIDSNSLEKIVSESFTGFESNYTQIKAANLKMHRMMLSNKIDIKVTVLLDMVARAIGYENHHSLKHNSERMHKKDKDLTFSGSEHPLAKFLMSRESIKTYMKEHGLSMGRFDLTHGKKEVSFVFQSPGQRYIHSMLQRETNIFFKSLGFTPYKNTIKLPLAFRTLDVQPAAELIERYNTLFKPIWIENPSSPGGFEDIARGSILPITFENIYDTGRGFLRVDDYTTDLVYNIVTDALDFAFYNGTDEICIDVAQILINIPKRQRFSFDMPGVTMATLSAVEEKYENDIVRSISESDPDAVIKKHREKTFLFRIQKHQIPFINYIEKYSGQKIGILMREMIDNAIEQNIEKLRAKNRFRFDFDASMDNISKRLCGITHQQLLDRDDDMWHHDMRKTIQHVLSEIIEHIEYVQKAIGRSV